MEREDRDIIQDIKKGSEAAMNELIKKYQKRVYNMVYGMCVNYDTAWDVSQEVFIKVVRNIDSFRGDSSFWTFLYRVTMNAFYDFKRKEKVRSRVANYTDTKAEDEKRVFEVRDMLNIEEDFEKKEAKERIKEALDGLTDVQKEVFMLKNMEGLKIREISAVLKISDGTVKSHLSRATEKIKSITGGGKQ
ncbi:MAG TPA: sigma-70 family RNA polymerase sigma factor [bacterium]|nr:sigma-70 family RNA polymerase sigma factor [bacterium]